MSESKTYTLELFTKSDGGFHLKRTNEGFSSIELLGLLNMVRDELREQIRLTTTTTLMANGKELKKRVDDDGRTSSNAKPDRSKRKKSK